MLLLYKNSRDLVPLDCNLFRSLEENLHVKYFDSVRRFKNYLTNLFQQKIQSLYEIVINKLVERCETIVKYNGGQVPDQEMVLQKILRQKVLRQKVLGCTAIKTCRNINLGSDISDISLSKRYTSFKSQHT